jgi:hypothetical protein
MFHWLLVDEVALSRDPNLADFDFDPGAHQPAFESYIGKKIFDVATCRMAVAALLGSVIAAPSRPPVVAIEPLLERFVGPEAFSDEMKKYTGRLVRRVVESMGGHWVRRGVKTNVASHYGSGSIYRFPWAPRDGGRS